MLKIMKYELRRQLFSKFVIFGGLFALVAAFFGFYWKGVEMGVMMILSLTAFATIVVLFYSPFEYLFTFDKDMNTKQGYMLLMVPKKSTMILGTKMLVSLLQTVVIYALFFTVVPFCERLGAEKFGVVPSFVSEIVSEFDVEFSGTLDKIEFWATLLLLWFFFFSLGLFVTALPGKGKVASVLGFAGYIAAIFVVFFLLAQVDALFDWLKIPGIVGNIFEWVYMLGIDLALFFGTAKLLDKKVSI